ncbi:SRPBCC family protein [Paenibacillus cremeus]|uniref:Polyketide cyclase n=1 Tax=Paenibacillus cremeus TaxID=2163881 RepID=A0A559KI34_9BACL|nr:SRPBCC family protein [Paenibacillus cremeus]TVY11794.1 polyketide cyclase [Paenibacillus cremeus]
MAATIGENVVINSREFEVPRELVYQAWTTPELLARWWGPNGFTNTFHEFDLRPGGEWRFIMHGPNGVDYPNHIEFVEIVPQERIVLKHTSSPEFQVTATFEDLGGRTKVTFRQQFMHAKEFEQAVKYCVEANEQNFDRMGELLKEMSA